MATPDVGRMGIEIVSFTIQDVFDSVEYLSSLGKTRAAEVKRDAEIGVALAERDAGIKESQCNKEAMDSKYGANTKIEDAHRLFQLQKAKFDSEVGFLGTIVIYWGQEGSFSMRMASHSFSLGFIFFRKFNVNSKNIR